jgi:hypothetical protein
VNGGCFCGLVQCVVLMTISLTAKNVVFMVFVYLPVGVASN